MTAAPARNLKDQAAPDLGLPGLSLNEALDAIGASLYGERASAPARFTFRWAGFRFKGSLRRLADGMSEVQLTARLGVLPFTAENADSRRAALQKLASQFGDLEGAYHITRAGEVQCSATTTFDGPVRAAPVAQSLTVTLLHLRKLLGRFEGLLLPVS